MRIDERRHKPLKFERVAPIALDQSTAGTDDTHFEGPQTGEIHQHSTYRNVQSAQQSAQRSPAQRSRGPRRPQIASNLCPPGRLNQKRRLFHRR